MSALLLPFEHKDQLKDALGRLITLFASAKSTITTWFVSLTFSRLDNQLSLGQQWDYGSSHADEMIRFQGKRLEAD